MQPKFLVFLFTTLLVLAIAATLWLTRPKIPQNIEVEATASTAEKWSAPPVPNEGYLGSTSCKECHAELYESYQTHPMAHALNFIGESTIVEDYADAKFAPIGREKYRVEKTQDGVLHHEYQSTVDGEVIYDQAVAVDYEVGSGKRGRSYIVDRDGLFFMSPITWYSESERWDLSPGYLPGNHKRFERRIPDGCIVCHSGRMNFDREQPHRYGTPPFFEKSIGCENCHGPGEAHVAFHNQEKPSGADPIVNPVDLTPHLREDVCNQCHLQGENRILRYKRTEHDFRPGMALEDIWVTFVRGDRASGTESTKAVSHVEQMRSSKCYTSSLGEMGCHSCHDPHSFPSAGEKQSFYQTKCLKCHTDQSCSEPFMARIQSEQGNSCVACHMPKLPANDVPHTTQTDHRILKNVEQAADSAILDRVQLFGNAAETLTQLQQDRAWGLYKISDATEKSTAYQVINLLTPVLKAAPDDLDTLNALATAHLLLDEHQRAQELLNEVLRYDPNNEGALRALAIQMHDQEQLQLAKRYLSKYLERNPWNADFHGRLAHVLGQLGEHDQAVESAKKSLELNPSLYQVHGWLSEAYRQLDQPLLASKHRKLFDLLKPLDQAE